MNEWNEELRVLGDPPPAPETVWDQALAHAFDPWAIPDPELVPDMLGDDFDYVGDEVAGDTEITLQGSSHDDVNWFSDDPDTFSGDMEHDHDWTDDLTDG